MGDNVPLANITQRGVFDISKSSLSKKRNVRLKQPKIIEPLKIFLAIIILYGG